MKGFELKAQKKNRNVPSIKENNAQSYLDVQIRILMVNCAFNLPLIIQNIYFV